MTIPPSLQRALLGITCMVIALGALFGMEVLPGEVSARPLLHTLLVGAMASVALGASLVIFRSAWQRFDLRAALVSSGFVAFAGMMLIHAASTPGGFVFSQHDHQTTVAFSGVLSVPMAALLILAAMVVPARVERSRTPIVIVQAIVVAIVGTFAAVGLLASDKIPSYALMQPPVSLLVLVPTTLIFAAASWRAYRTAAFTRRGSDSAVFAGVVLLSMSIIAYVTSQPFDLQFWAGHAIELIGFTTLAVGIAVDVRRPMSQWRLNHQVDGQRFLTSSEELLGGHVHALTVTLAQIDPHTWNHSRRVAEYAVAVGEELGLPWSAVRRLAVAGLVHDIGKLQIPRDVLHKAGALSDEEFDLIRQHPEWGSEILEHLRGFGGELPIVRGHHEQLSGRGYPDKLAGDQIGLETRIMTVCDVFDALTDARSYKEPWPVPRALELLRQDSGTSFDATVVAALERVLIARNQFEPGEPGPLGEVIALRASHASDETGSTRAA